MSTANNNDFLFVKIHSESINKEKGFETIPTLCSEDADKFVNNSILISTNDKTTEAHINLEFAIHLKKIGPFHFDIMSKQCEVFNSESSNWLPPANEGKLLKPDLFVCNPAFVKFSNTSINKGNNSEIINAIPVKPQFVMAVFEGKSGCLSKAHYGKLIYYLQSLNKFQRVSCGVVFNASNFFFAIMKEGSLTEVWQGTWSTPDAIDFILQHILSAQSEEVVYALNKALGQFQSSEEFEAPRISSFLGSGASGYVFKVQSNDGEDSYALKIVVCSDSNNNSKNDIVDDFGMLKRMNENEDVNEFVVQLHSLDLLYYHHNEILTICGYLMDVGESRPSFSKNVRKTLFLLLSQLHQNKYIHGDPRSPNAIIFNNSWRWIDVRVSYYFFNEESIKIDLILFIKSFYKIHLTDQLEGMIDEYCENMYNYDNWQVNIMDDECEIIFEAIEKVYIYSY